jgi:hypothetical protein
MWKTSRAPNGPFTVPSFAFGARNPFRPLGNNPAIHRVEPKIYARAAIDAAARLIADPGHADWVHEHWGKAYLDT